MVRRMSGTALTGQRRVTLTPVHLVRAGVGRDAVRVEARGVGLIFGSLGLLRVRGSLDVVLLRRLRSNRCRALFIGLHGVAWASVRLPPAGRTSVPAVGDLHAPELPPAPALPALDVNLTVNPPEPP